MGGESSYTDLLTCLEMTRDVRKLHSEANNSSAPTQQVPSAPPADAAVASRRSADTQLPPQACPLSG
jgi:hypothetical protein